MQHQQVSLTPLQRAQRRNIETVCRNARRESAQLLRIAQAQAPDAGLARLQDVPTSLLAQAREVYDQGQTAWTEPLPYPEMWIDYRALAEQTRAGPGQVKPKRKPRPYRPWPLERRQRLGVTKLKARALKLSSFPEFWQPWLQAKLLDNPWRFGVCLLPEVRVCTIPDPTGILARQDAIAREAELRQAEVDNPIGGTP